MLFRSFFLSESSKIWCYVILVNTKLGIAKNVSIKLIFDFIFIDRVHSLVLKRILCPRKLSDSWVMMLFCLYRWFGKIGLSFLGFYNHISQYHKAQKTKCQKFFIHFHGRANISDAIEHKDSCLIRIMNTIYLREDN